MLLSAQLVYNPGTAFWHNWITHYCLLPHNNVAHVRQFRSVQLFHHTFTDLAQLDHTHSFSFLETASLTYIVSFRATRYVTHILILAQLANTQVSSFAQRLHSYGTTGSITHVLSLAQRDQTQSFSSAQQLRSNKYFSFGTTGSITRVPKLAELEHTQLSTSAEQPRWLTYLSFGTIDAHILSLPLLDYTQLFTSAQLHSYTYGSFRATTVDSSHIRWVWHD
jgi:hypothetical protein